VDGPCAVGVVEVRPCQYNGVGTAREGEEVDDEEEDLGIYF